MLSDDPFLLSGFAPGFRGGAMRSATPSIGRHNCFFNQVSATGIEVIAEVEVDPKRLYGE